MTAIDHFLAAMAEDGFAIVPAVFVPYKVDAMLAGIERAFRDQPEAVAIRSGGGAVFAARNVLALWPEAESDWREPPLPEFFAALLGSGFGLVRSLFFDKPPERNWALPWHRDLTVAVRDNRVASRAFCKPTVKAGVPHVEAPRELLERMVTIRIHLDEVTEENGPLKVIPGSHRIGEEPAASGGTVRAILAGRGDVLLMRPLLVHSSGHANPGCTRRRRILHLEFAASAKLPDGYEWHDFRSERAPPFVVTRAGAKSSLVV